MRKLVFRAIACLVFMVAGSVFLPTLVSKAQAGASDDSLRAELRGNDSKQPIFRPNFRNDIHFLLFSKRDRTKIFQEWCSWGYFTRSFSAKSVGGKAGNFIIKRNPNKIWTKNYPATHSLNKGEFTITSADLCDGTWISEPVLPLEDMELRLTGHLEIRADAETGKQKVWTGKLSTRPLVIIMGRGCTEILNKQK